MNKVFSALIAVEAVLVAAGIAVASMKPAELKTAGDSMPINACALLSSKDVAATIGKDVTDGERRDDGFIADNPFVTAGTYSSTCFWRVVDPAFVPDPTLPLSGASFIMLNAMQWPDGDAGAHRFLQGFHDAFEAKAIDNKPIAVDVKDEALWWGDGVAGRKRDRSYGISVHVVGDTKDQERAREVTLAKKIASRL